MLKTRALSSLSPPLSSLSLCSPSISALSRPWLPLSAVTRRRRASDRPPPPLPIGAGAEAEHRLSSSGRQRPGEADRGGALFSPSTSKECSSSPLVVLVDRALHRPRSHCTVLEWRSTRISPLVTLFAGKHRYAWMDCLFGCSVLRDPFFVNRTQIWMLLLDVCCGSVGSGMVVADYPFSRNYFWGVQLNPSHFWCTNLSPVSC